MLGFTVIFKRRQRITIIRDDGENGALTLTEVDAGRNERGGVNERSLGANFKKFDAIGDQGKVCNNGLVHIDKV